VRSDWRSLARQGGRGVAVWGRARGRLHATPARHLLATVGAGVNHVLAPVHAEWDQAATKVTPDKAEDEADDPGEGARLKLSCRDNLGLAVGAPGVHR